MANFSSFFPAPASGGGGFTKMKKYTTFRALDDATDKQLPNINLKAVTTNQGSSATTNVYYTDDFGADFTAANSFVGYSFTTSGYAYTVTSSGANSGENSNFSVTVTVPQGYTAIGFNWWADYGPLFLSPSITVNPATDLGLSDGDSIGYFLVGGAWKRASSTYGAMGGKITQGTAIISNASTDLILTPGDGKQGGSYATSDAPGESTISGGLTITSADGHSRSGSAGRQSNFAPGYGINGYGQGTVPYNDSPNSQLVQDVPYHGFGSGVSSTASQFGSDGAILIFY